jgi:hypothetical protein
MDQFAYQSLLFLPLPVNRLTASRRRLRFASLHFASLHFETTNGH